MLYAPLVVNSQVNSCLTVPDRCNGFTPCPKCGPPTSYTAWQLCRLNGILDNYKAKDSSLPEAHRSSDSGCSSACILCSRFLRDPVSGQMSCFLLPAAVNWKTLILFPLMRRLHRASHFKIRSWVHCFRRSEQSVVSFQTSSTTQNSFWHQGTFACLACHQQKVVWYFNEVPPCLEGTCLVLNKHKGSILIRRSTLTANFKSLDICFFL